MKRVLPLLLLSSLLWQCATYTDESARVREDYYRGEFSQALEKIEKSSLKESSKDHLLYLLEKSMILDRMGERTKSRDLLIKADKQVDKLYTTSILKTAASFVYNDSATDYGGEDYERINIHTMLALSFLQDKALEEAGVEARKINLVLKKITKEYGDTNNSYQEDAFALYLSGIIHEASGELDDAIIDYNKALEVFAKPGYKQFYLGPVPDNLAQALYLLAVKRQRTELVDRVSATYPEAAASAKMALKEGRSSQIIAFHEIGHIAIKRARDFVFPLGGQIIRISFPYIEYNQRYAFANTGIDLEGGGFYPARNCAYLNSIAHFSLEDRRGRMILKTGARLIAKAAIAHQADKNFGPIAGLATSIFTAATETADTRGWTFLPEAFAVSRAWVQPGKHRMKLSTNGRIDQVELVELDAGKIRLFRSY